MAGLDEAALTCDFAETYHVLDWRALPARLAATLAMGLRPDSRIMMKLSGTNVPQQTLLLAMLADISMTGVWMQTKDGAKGRHRPKSILAALMGEKKEKETEGFDSPDEFRAWYASMTGGNTDA